ncbi:MAG: LLM class flavin-dependent oxidoreductase [Solirubrobacterales bacterium]
MRVGAGAVPLDIDEMSGGRFRLGIGAGVKRLNEAWHNADYGKPAPHLREAIEATRLTRDRRAPASRSATRATTRASTSGAGCVRTRRRARRCLSTPPPCLPTVCCAIDQDGGRAIEMARRTISF